MRGGIEKDKREHVREKKKRENKREMEQGREKESIIMGVVCK